MVRARRCADHGRMTRSSAQRILLVPAARAGEDEAQYRRYRLARLQIAEKRADTSGRFGHLKRAHD